TTCDGEVIKVGAYPSLVELRGMTQESHKVEPLIKLNFRTDAGCCSVKDSSEINCDPKSGKNSGGNAPRCY
ncbi:MAG: hypothetical protein NTZ34_04005, partial [Chloroflexi bacterium]|nr:hypothetical protein [Chloroflexota bacterium]